MGASTTVPAQPGAYPPPAGLVRTVPPDELVELCALDTELYNRTFFPEAFRQGSPQFHRDIDQMLESRANRYVAVEVFRGGAKTTKLRAYASKRIAYGTSRTILFVSEAQEHAKKSLAWLRKRIENKGLWSQLFGLEPGQKWTDEVIEIKSRIFKHTATVIAFGITGQIRGVNIDDYRPDLIVVDDPCDEENTATPEQRKKTTELFFGALQNTLAPRSESPDAKMVLLQTSLHADDLINCCHRDPAWVTAKFGCLDENGESRWPARFPTAELLQEKSNFIQRGQLPLWLREWECTIVSGESADFRAEWLQYYTECPPVMSVYMGIDPVPPPSDSELAKGLAKKDFEVLSVIGCISGRRYLLDYSKMKGHDPEWTITEFFRLLDKWRPMRVRVEGIAYQKTLKWILEREMQKRRRYVQINCQADQRKKRHRITQAFSGIASQKQLFIRREMTDFYEQFISYPNVAHDDILDSVAMALDEANAHAIDVDFEVLGEDESAIPSLPSTWRKAP